MSYTCYLNDPVTGECLQSENPHHIRGGTYAMYGTTCLEFNVTYNYGGIIRGVLDGGIPGLDGKLGAATIPLLRAAIDQLGDDVDPDYWKPTEGNVKRALFGLLALAEMRPDGVWEVC